MRVLIDTDWADILDELSSEKKLEIFDCILRYPEKTSTIRIWNFIKKQIEHDQTTYRNRCKGLSVARKNRYPMQSEQIEKQSDDFLSAPSAAITNGDDNNDSNNNTEDKNKVSALVARLANNFNINSEPKYEIYSDFSFSELAKRDLALGEILAAYPEQVLLKTQAALVRKCFGKKMTLRAIMAWVEGQNKYCKEGSI